MPALLSPQPLLPAFQIVESAPPIYYNKSYSRLRSPPLRPESPTARSFAHLEPFQLQPLQPLSQTSPRRRPKATQRSHRHRRIASRVDYLREQSPLHAFDKLPWIASLNVPPGSDYPWGDIADLSLVHMPDPVLPHFRPSVSGPGPIRRRKVSLRSSPVLPSSTSTDAHVDDHLPLPNLFPRDSPTRPSTPATSRFDPSRVTFRNLMPVIDDGL